MEFKGLSSKEVQKNLKKHGFNEIKDVSKFSLLKIFFRQIKSNFIIYLLFFAMLLSFFVGKFVTAYVILVVIFLVIFTGFFQEYKAEKAIEKLKEMVMPVCVVIRDSKEQEILTRELVPGDIVVLRNGEKVPADCVVLSEKNLLLNEAVLTGEADEVKKIPVTDLNNISKENEVFAGSFIVNGKCIARVLNTGMDTKFGKIASLISEHEKDLPLKVKINTISRYMAFLGLLMAIITGLAFSYQNGFSREFFPEVLILVIAIAVSSFPEGFPVVLITTLSLGAYKMAKKNAIVNRMSIIETLGETTIICSDKTGTITKGEMTAKRIFLDNRLFDVTGVGYEGVGDFIFNGKKINASEESVLNLFIQSGVLCNDANIEKVHKEKVYGGFGAPTEIALLIMGAKANVFKEDFNERIDEIPFSSERKMMSVLVKGRGKNFVYSKGALEFLLKHCKYIKRNNGVFRLTSKEKERIFIEVKKMTSNSLRTLGLAYKESNSNKIDEEDLIFLGFVGMEDPPREGVKEALVECKKAGIKTKMITGDDKETAIAISKQIGLDEGEVLLGEDIEKFSDKELIKRVSGVSIFARVKPEHKLRIVKALKENGEIVTMTGDGVNDAPALKVADIGVAMGKNGTDVSRSVADLTLRDDNFITLVDAIKEGRTIFTNIQKFSTYQISVNFSQVALIFLAVILGLPLPLVAIQILFMNLFSDELTAITLAFNPYSSDVMDNRPRKRSNIITKPLLVMLILSGLVMSLGSLGVFYYSLNLGKSEIAARTTTFITMVFFGIINAFNFRSFRKTTINRSVLTNKPLFFVSLFTIFITLLIIYSPLNFILEVVKISPFFWLVAILVSFSVIFIFDLFKFLKNKYGWFED